jgi:hypothetical protein
MALSAALIQALTDYAFAVAQDERAVLRLASLLAPTVECGAASIEYATFHADNDFQVYNAKRGVGGKAQRIAFGSSKATADLAPFALEIGIDDHELVRAGPAIDTLRRAKTRTTVVSAYNAHCYNVVTAAKAGVTAVAGRGNWSSANVDPIDELDEQIQALSRILTPNMLLLDIGAWRIAKNNPKVKGRFTAKGFGLADFAGQLLNPNIQVELTPVAFNSLGFANASQDKAGALSAEAWLFYTSAAPTPYDPSFMKTFATKAALFDGVKEYREEQTRSDILAIDWTAQEKVISTLLVKRLAIT